MKNNVFHLTFTALFVALILLLGLTPLGLISIFGVINVTILCVPVIVGTLLMGLKTGLALGACFGGVSALAAFGIWGTPSALAGALVSANPLLALIMCFAPRLMVPVVTHFTYRLFANGRAKSNKVVPIAAAAGSLTNTILYLGMMLLFYVISGIEAESLLAWIAGTGIIAGSAEALVAALISSPVLAALWKIKRTR